MGRLEKLPHFRDSTAEMTLKVAQLHGFSSSLESAPLHASLRQPHPSLDVSDLPLSTPIT